MLNDQLLVTTIVSAAWLLTVGGVSGPGVKPSRLGTVSINDEMGAEIRDDIVVGAPTTGATLSGKMLECKELSNNNQ